MTTTDNPSPQTEQAKPSFFCTIASRESHPLLSREELVRIIKHDAMVAARTDDFRKRKAISAELAREAKLMMPGITASALMDGKGKELCNLVRPTYVMAVDIDHIPSPMMEETKRRADEDPHTMMRYVTASGQGLRILCRYTPLDDEDVTVAELFDVMVRKAMGHYSRLLGVPADEQCHDITRMCGLAHDPTLFCRWDSVAFGMDAKDLKALYAKKANQEKYAKRAARRKTPTRKASRKQDSAAIPTMQEAAPHIEGLMERWGYRFESGRHNEYVLHYAKVCVRYGIPREEVMQHCATQFGPYYPDYASVVKACYRKLQLLGTWEFHREGERTPSKATAKAIKQWLGMRYEFHRNVVTGAYELRSRDVARGLFPRWTRIDDNIENSLWCLMDEAGFQLAATKLHSIINSDFSEPWDPFDEYLRSLPRWDGERDYIQELADRIKVNHCPGYHHSQEEFRYFFKKWMVSMVVGWVSPREVSQTILVFIGRGGINKSTFFYFLLPPQLREYFINDSTACYTDKDTMEAFCSKALICYDEFEIAFGRNLSAFKSNVTKLVFSIRRPYDKYRSEMLHRAALCGTSNTVQIISDGENRRYSPWYVDNIVNPRESPIDYTHVYAQAVTLGQEVRDRGSHGDGDWVYWLTADDIETMRCHNGMFMVTNYMEEQVLRYYRVPQPDTDQRFIRFRFSAEIMERIGGSPALSRNMAQQNLSSVMAKLGFQKVHRAQGNGWAVIEKEGSELNNQSFL